MNGDHAHFLAFGHEVVNGFFGSLGNGAHGYDHALGLGMAVVVEEVIFATGDSGDFLHVVLHDFGHGLVVLVAAFAVLEEDVAVLGHAAGHGSIGAEGACTELVDSVHVEERSNFVLLDHFNFLDFMRGAESVEEVDERHAALDGGEMGHS